jgi:hypothetical protein
MCTSPHEITSARIEELIVGIEQDIAQYPNHAFRQIWEGRHERYTQLLKERAEDGTYDTAGVVDQQTETYR